MIAEDPETHGAMFAPVILGSDKTTVSVATGQNEYYPLYAGIGKAQNHVRRAHRNALALVGFLAIPKSMCGLFESVPAITEIKTADKRYQDSNEFHRFRHQLFH